MNDFESEPSGKMSGNVGERVVALRVSHGYSQRELARRSGLTNGAISQIEQDQVSPTVASLQKIARAFGLTLSEFFAPGIESSQQYFFRSDELREIGSAGVSLRLVAADNSQKALAMLHEKYEPGADTGSESLTHEGEEAGVVVRGEISLTIGGETRRLGPGDAYHFPSRLPHRFHNESNDWAEMVSAATPPTF